jgi:putative FmdB family regulatory protein
MPIYEFRCDACAAEFDVLIRAGKEPGECVECGSNELRRAYSPPAAPHRLVKSPGEAGKQERANAKLREGAKARFKEARARARTQASRGADGKR